MVIHVHRITKSFSFIPIFKILDYVIQPFWIKGLEAILFLCGNPDRKLSKWIDWNTFVVMLLYASPAPVYVLCISVQILTSLKICAFHFWTSSFFKTVYSSSPLTLPPHPFLLLGIWARGLCTLDKHLYSLVLLFICLGLPLASYFRLLVCPRMSSLLQVL